MKFLMVVVLLLSLPLAVIWAINVLMGLGIAYTFKTWFAAFVLMAIFSVEFKTKG